MYSFHKKIKEKVMRKTWNYVLMLSLVVIVITGLILGCSSATVTQTATKTTTNVQTTTATSIATTTATTVKTTTATTTAGEKVFRLTFQGKWVGMEKQEWAIAQMKLTDAVKAATNGRILLTNVNEIVSDANILDGVRTGVLDIAVQGLHSRGELALMNFISMPFVSFDKLYDLLNQTESVTFPAWDKLGVKALGNNVFLPQRLFTSKPCSTFDQLVSMKLRITGTIVSDLLSKAGGHPLTMENSEVYQAIQRGTIDGSQSAIAGYIGNAWYEVAKNISEWPLGCNALGIIMNKDVWNDLGPDLQAKLIACIEQEEKDQFQGAKNDITTLFKTATDKGATINDPTQAEKDKLLKFVGPAVADWKAKVGADGTQIMTIVNKVLGTNY
jgi:TRAP-type C4-dicarboxylate transport system substrate-binding protein